MKNKPISKLILKLNGIDISKFDVSFLENSLQRKMNDTNCDSEDAYCSFVEQNENESTAFIESLFVGYSEFFRNTLSFAVLERIVLANILSKKGNSNRKEIRIWSAACSKGQEAYSLAMLLKELKDIEGEEINFRIFATDSNEKVVNEAQKGEYTADEISNLSLIRIKKWFNKKGENYSVKPELKENIEFSVFDLLNEEHIVPPSSIFGNFNLVVCANLLFYYKPEIRKLIIDKVIQSLSKNGYLMTGETERNIILQQNLVEVYPQSAIFKCLA